MKKLLLVLLGVVISIASNAQLAKWVLNPYKSETPTYSSMEWLEQQHIYKVLDDNGLYGFLDECGNPLLAPAFQNVEPFENGVAIITDTDRKTLIGFITEDCQFQDYSVFGLQFTVNGAKFNNGRLLLEYSKSSTMGSYVYLLLDNIKNKTVEIEGDIYLTAYPYMGEFASVYLIDKEHPDKGSFVCLRNGINFFDDGTPSASVKVWTLRGLKEFSIKKISYISSAFKYDDGNGEHENIFMIINGICCRYDVALGEARAIVYKKYNEKKDISTDELVMFKGIIGHSGEIKAEGAEFHFDEFGRLKETIYNEKYPHTELVSFVADPPKPLKEAPSSIWCPYKLGDKVGLRLKSNMASVLPPQFADVLVTQDRCAVVKTKDGKCGIIEVDPTIPPIIGEINGGKTVNFYAEREDSELKLYLPKYITDNMINELYSLNKNSSVDRGVAPIFNGDIKTHNVYSNRVRLYDRKLKVREGRIMCGYALRYDNILSDTIKIAFNTKFVQAWNWKVDENAKIIRKDSTYTLIVKYSFEVVPELKRQVDERDLATSITGVFPRKEAYYQKYNLNPRVESESQVAGKIEFQLSDVMNQKKIAKEDLNVPISLELRQGDSPIQSFTDFISIELPKQDIKEEVKEQEIVVKFRGGR